MSLTSQAEFDRLELELRKLPDVVAVGFEGPTVGSPITDDAILTVHLTVGDPDVRTVVEAQALDLGRLHLTRPLRIVVAPEDHDPEVDLSNPDAASLSTLSRVRMLGVKLVESGRAVEVTLGHGDRRAIGRGVPGSPSGAAEASLDALRQLGWSVPFEVGAGVRLAVGTTGAVLVHLRGRDGDRLGVSVGDTAEIASVKATLQALNRWLDDPSRQPMAVYPATPGG